MPPVRVSRPIESVFFFYFPGLRENPLRFNLKLKFLTSQKWHFPVRFFFSAWVIKSVIFILKLNFLTSQKWCFYRFFFLRFEWAVRRNFSFKSPFFFPSKNGILEVRYFIRVSIIFPAFCLSAAFWVTSRIKTVQAGERDCPQDNQALQASTDFRFETGLRIVFISCACCTTPLK